MPDEIAGVVGAIAFDCGNTDGAITLGILVNKKKTTRVDLLLMELDTDVTINGRDYVKPHSYTKELGDVLLYLLATRCSVTLWPRPDGTAVRAEFTTLPEAG